MSKAEQTLKQIREILNRDGLYNPTDVLVEIDQLVPGEKATDGEISEAHRRRVSQI